MEQAVEECRLETKCFEIQKKQVLIKNDRLLDQIMSQDIVNIVVNSSVNVNSFVAMNESMTVNDKFVDTCQKCLELESELLKKNNVISELSTRFSNLEKHCISLEVVTQLSQENFQTENSCVNQNNPDIREYFENNDLKAHIQAKDTIINKLEERIYALRDNPDKVKKDIDEIETINIKLELLSKNEDLHKEIMHLKQIYKDQFDSIKKTRVSNKEHNDSLIAQMNSKSVENAHLRAQIQEKVFANTALKNELRRIKGKDVVDIVASKPKATTIAPGMEHANVLREIVEEARASNPLDSDSDLACKYAKRLQEELVYVHDSCPCLATHRERLIAVTPKNKDSKVRHADPVTSLKHSVLASILLSR
ncbi:hypothetical protein Tco_1054251 [Tanacetum coccineum]|uniref:Uncharacterized protein n=1 Tax=Tanacetum coccineum TaxID=301880 RepID=A0ABQ5GX52_9ASTR